MIYLSGSGWSSRPTTLEPALSGNLSCDVAVIGGGLGGMSAALKLAELGADVVLLEADMCGWGASARNAGYLTPTLGAAPWILDRFHKDRAVDLFRFANAAVAFTEEFIAGRAIDCDPELDGFVAASTTAAGYRRMRATTRSGKRSSVGSAEELGIPPSFYGGVHVKVGGALDPGKFSLGVRELVRASAARVFERSPVRAVTDAGGSVVIETPAGEVRAARALLTVNAFSNQLGIAPRNLARPVWVTAVETEPIAPERIDAAGWTSRLPLLTTHNIMHSFRTTARGTIVHTTRNLQVARRARHGKMPAEAVVDDLIRGFRERFPTLREVASERAWGGWIGDTPLNMAVVGRATPNVHYSLACSGHGLPQAPYVGTMLAEYIQGHQMPGDLRAIWREKPRFMPGIVNPFVARLGWIDDRVRDLLDRRR